MNVCYANTNLNLCTLMKPNRYHKNTKCNELTCLGQSNISSLYLVHEACIELCDLHVTDNNTCFFFFLCFSFSCSLSSCFWRLAFLLAMISACFLLYRANICFTSSSDKSFLFAPICSCKSAFSSFNSYKFENFNWLTTILPSGTPCRFQEAASDWVNSKKS